MGKKVVVSPSVLTAAKAKLAQLTQSWTAGVCFGTCLDLQGHEMVTPHTACHSWVGYVFRNLVKDYDGWASSYTEGAKPFLTLSCHAKKNIQGGCSHEAHDAIILWMARESPFSEFVLNRDDDESLLNDGIILLCGPGGLTWAQTMWVCKVLRYGVEGGKALDTWLTLYKGGVNPLLAVVVCSYVRSVQGATFGYTGVEAHSSVMNAWESPNDDISDLLKGVLNPAAENTSQVFLFKTGGGKRLQDRIHNFCKPISKSDGWGEVVKSNGVDGRQLVKKVLAWQNKYTPTKRTVKKGKPL